jgi:hypothetical protein
MDDETNADEEDGKRASSACSTSASPLNRRPRSHSTLRRSFTSRSGCRPDTRSPTCRPTWSHSSHLRHSADRPLSHCLLSTRPLATARPAKSYTIRSQQWLASASGLIGRRHSSRTRSPSTLLKRQPLQRQGCRPRAGPRQGDPGRPHYPAPTL